MGPLLLTTLIAYTPLAVHPELPGHVPHSPRLSSRVATTHAHAASQPAVVTFTVTAEGRPVEGVEIAAAGQVTRTDARGEAHLEVPAGTVEVTITHPDFLRQTSVVSAEVGRAQPVIVEMVPASLVRESVTVAATRTERGLDTQPMRVEVLDRDEIDEKLMMTPGDIVMLLNEMGGMRVQATSPSIGAASVRVQGMKGRYTRFLSDGLPLFGERVSLGLMQIPPMDLGRVEVIKGVASSLYGAGAIGGIVNLVSRRPGNAPERQVLVNRSLRGATDLSAWYAAPLSETWGLTLLTSLNGHQRNDRDGDNWADLPRYERLVLRPRLYWQDGKGRALLFTSGGTWENRRGGSMPDRRVSTIDGPYAEALGTRRTDAGASFQAVSKTGVVWTLRGSWTSQRQDHEFGERSEHDERETRFAELTARRAVGRQTLVAGLAVSRDAFEPVGHPQFAYTFTVPGAFLQDDVDLTRWVTVSGSARVDRHNRFGTFLSPQLAGIVRRGLWSTRVSIGTGFAAPTPITEETDAAGLSRLIIPDRLRAERGRSASVDVTRTAGPLSTTVTLFHSRVRDPVAVERDDRFVMANQSAPMIAAGLEALAIWRADDLSLVANYAYVASRETVESRRVDVPLTPRHSVGVDLAYEWSQGVRLGIEWYFTGAQRLEANPYRSRSQPYSVFGVLATRALGSALLFLNGENLTGVRQTRWDPLVRPSRAVDGRWTVDAWAPLEGRNINGGVRITF